jgi:hypothetical protein
MSRTTFEEAIRCPKCDQPNEVVSTAPAPQGVISVTECKNERCKWFGPDNRRAIQVLPDGTVPVRETGRNAEKDFPAMSEGQMAMGRRIIEDAINRDLREGGV